MLRIAYYAIPRNGKFGQCRKAGDGAPPPKVAVDSAQSLTFFFNLFDCLANEVARAAPEHLPFPRPRPGNSLAHWLATCGACRRRRFVCLLRLQILALLTAQTRQPLAESALGGKAIHRPLYLTVQQRLRPLNQDDCRIGRDNWIFILKPRSKALFHFKQIDAFFGEQAATSVFQFTPVLRRAGQLRGTGRGVSIHARLATGDSNVAQSAL